jgi:protein ImuA
MTLVTTTERTEIISGLRRDLKALEIGGSCAGRQAAIPLGIPAIDDALADRGLRLGALHEFCGPAAAGFVLAFLSTLEGALMWCAGGHHHAPLYPPGLARLGLDMSAFVMARPRRRQDALWIAEEGLKSGALAAVALEAAFQISLTESRRLQLAAEESGCLGLMLRPAGVAASTSAARTRWQVSSRPVAHGEHRQAWQLELARNRGGSAGRNRDIWEVTWDGTAHRFHLVSETCHRSPCAIPAA